MVTTTLRHCGRHTSRVISIETFSRTHGFQQSMLNLFVTAPLIPQAYSIVNDTPVRPTPKREPPSRGNLKRIQGIQDANPNVIIPQWKSINTIFGVCVPTNTISNKNAKEIDQNNVKT